MPVRSRAHTPDARNDVQVPHRDDDRANRRKRTRSRAASQPGMGSRSRVTTLGNTVAATALTPQGGGGVRRGPAVGWPSALKRARPGRAHADGTSRVVSAFPGWRDPALGSRRAGCGVPREAPPGPHRRRTAQARRRSRRHLGSLRRMGVHFTAFPDPPAARAFP